MIQWNTAMSAHKPYIQVCLFVNILNDKAHTGVDHIHDLLFLLLHCCRVSLYKERKKHTKGSKKKGKKKKENKEER